VSACAGNVVAVFAHCNRSICYAAKEWKKEKRRRECCGILVDTKAAQACALSSIYGNNKKGSAHPNLSVQFSGLDALTPLLRIDYAIWPSQGNSRSAYLFRAYIENLYFIRAYVEIFRA
jgi:hypothetical protein